LTDPAPAQHPAARTAFFAACLLVIGLPWSPFLLSLAQAGLLFAGLWYAVAETDSSQAFSIRLATGLRNAFQNLLRSPVLLLLTLLFWMPALSRFWTEYTPGWANFTRIRLGFLLLPLAFANLPPLSKRQYAAVLYVLVWIMLVLCIGVGINFALHYDLIIDDLNHGRPVPVPRNHIRFSLLLALSIFSGGWLWLRGFVCRYAWERHLLAATLLLLFAFIHVLSVRSGLVALYAGLVFTVFWVIFRTGRWKIGLAALALICLSPVVAWRLMPSLQHRISYMRYDWERYKNREGGTYSDADRWISLQIGWTLFREHPWTGIGAGDMQIEVQRMANDHFPQYSLDPKMPHNQYIWILAAVGLPGLLVSLLALLAPLSVRVWRQSYLFAVFQVMVFLSFMVEYTLETAIGVAYYLFFTLWLGRLAAAWR
jgi:O-antigen ligase